MKKLFLASAILLFGFTAGYSQKAAKVVFIEAGGPGLASLNLDTRFSKKEDGWGGRIGMGGFYIEGEGAVFIPATINYITSKNGRDYFEIGAGATYVAASSSVDTGSPFRTTSGHFNFGYRLQPKEGGFFFRATINPVFGKGFFWPYYGGVSIGYKF
ncbi:MAG: hypothetical protein K2X48_09805 [Chitinophagaceae bacterium]|nr:hypothetical protein [Chitinophagaceae bacterium]